mmetsp:Transcript_7664/g.9766  ORF Transcript_7664/g.9766 Transcript_7664/m.9766 type:complete len:874 (+) Transcript_7664:346-2967(+)
MSLSAASTKSTKSTNSIKLQPPPSKFKECLSDVVPKAMLEGISVVKVNANGKTKSSYLTLSADKFTIYITSNKFKAGKVGKNIMSSIRRPLLLKVTSIGSNDDESEYEGSIDIGSIERIQRGQNTLRFELARKISNRLASPKASDAVDMDEESSFSIIYGGERTIDLMISDDAVSRDEVVNALNNLFNTYNKAILKVGNDVLLLRHIWTDVDRDNNNSINAIELGNILNRINFYMKKSDLDHMYTKFGKMIGLDRSDRRKGVSFEVCLTILHKIKRDSTWQIKPVRQIWFDLFGEYMNNGKPRSKVSSESFLKKFIWQKQGESQVTAEDVENTFKHLNELEYAHVASNLHLNGENAGKYIDRDRFEAYLVSKENDIFDPEKEKFDQDIMHSSLSHYWINSSHNTYLTGDQLKSRSSVEMYMNALYRGCRCLELDCFDGYRNPDGTPVPIVYHGGTMTSKILFSDIISGIKFFLTNNPGCYPLILSLENHCSLPFQDSMVQSLVSIFGDSLYVPDESSLFEPLPSPEELKGKVLIKGKRLTDMTFDNQESYDSDSDDDSVIIEDQEQKVDGSVHTNSPKSVKSASKQSISQISSTSSSDISSKLSRITIFHGIRLGSFEENTKKSKDNMLSFDESKGRRLCRHPHLRQQWVKYNKTHLSRIYPSAKRIVSSNFSPITGWSTGCQLMALNLQTSDQYRRLNDGRFRQNGDSGYVLKPPSLLNNDITPTPVSLSIRVLCGTCLPKPRGYKRGECIDPYVQVNLYDIPRKGGKELVTTYSTHHVHRNGFNPIWVQDHSFKFKVQNPDVAMLQFSVWDKDVASTDDFVGGSSVPVSCIREGYRSVQIFDANNKRNGAFERASLLVEVKLKKGQEIKMW